MDADLETFKVFPWSDNLQVGIEVIDEQHQKLVDILNRLMASLVSCDDAHLSEVFQELAAYAEYHFKTEEAIWASHFGDDEWFSRHQKTHSSFLPQVMELKERQGNLPLNKSLESVVKFLVRWLVFHIVDSDMRMAKVVANLEQGMPLKEAKADADEQMRGYPSVLINIVLHMYEGISTRALDLMREREERRKAEEKLREAYARLEMLAVTDELTGLFNRRYFEQVFEQEINRARREKRELTFVIFDIDHFKKLNDRYGHLAGDEALKKVGAKLQELCKRPGDFAFRLGGEEFGVIIAEEKSGGAMKFVEIIRSGIEGLQVPNEGSDVSDYMTVSLGVISKEPDLDDTIGSFMRVADERLYEAKKLGRNRAILG